MNISDVTIILLASGLSTRFEDGDKLLAKLNGQTVLETVANKVNEITYKEKLAIVGANQISRKRILSALGWKIIENQQPENGQGHSLALGVQAASIQNAKAIMVILADMPFIQPAHLFNLSSHLDIYTDAVFSNCEATFSPPAIFSKTTFSALANLSGDTGAKSILSKESKIRSIPLDAASAMDIDNLEHLQIAALRFKK